MKKIYLLLVLSCISIVASAQTTTSFAYTGSVQTYTVGAGVTQIAVDLAGAQGGDYPSHGTGGNGGRVQATVNVTPGQVLYIYVGQKGNNGGTGSVPAGGSNSGGGADGGAGSSSIGGAAGGGATDIRTTSGNNATALSSRILVGGGGGGGAWDCGENGGSGGGLTGGTGTDCGSYNSTSEGTPGTQTGGGSAGCSGTTCGTAGGFGYGGNAYATYYGSGGGGGWYGAGGAYSGAGGGGSSYYGSSSVASGASTTAGYQSGNGYVYITALGPFVTAAPSSLNFGIVTSGTSSIPYTTTLSGGSLTSGGTLTITPPSNFQISLDSTTWSTSALTYSYTGGSFSNVKLYVKFLPTAVTSYSANIAITGGGLVATMNIPVSGIGANACSGTPTAGTASVSPLAGGTTTPFTLTLTGYSTTGGITFQWQQSADGGTTWTNITGATNATYNFTGISATTQYRAVVTCGTSGLSANSSVATASMYPLSSCTPTWFYPSSGCTYGMVVGTPAYPFVLTGAAGLTLTDASACSSTGYTDNSSSSTLTTTLWPGFTYSVTIGANASGSAYQMSDQIWIDFNNNGTFETSESVGGSASWSSIQTTHTITLPTTGVTAGMYRMRVITTYACCGAPGYPPYPSIPPCPTTAQYYGDARDYKITISIPPSCTAPTAQPTALTFGTPALYTMPISFTAPASAPDNYLVVATTSSVAPTAPSNYTSYPVGSTALGGKVVYAGGSTSFIASGLNAGTTYWFWVYSANAFCTPGPLYLGTSPLSGSATTANCAISGIKTVGPTGDYATLTAAMAALNNYGVAGPVALELQTTYSASSETFPVVVPNLPCVSATNNVVIRPQGTMTVSASYSGPLISMNGARYVTIDGRVSSTGTTKALTIVNTSTSGQDVMLVNDAQFNKLKYVTFRGVSTSTAYGVITFSVSPTGSTGNSYNRVDNCDILDGASNPLMSIYSFGTSGKENKYDTISNCNIANHFGTSTTAGIYLTSYNTYWNIDNNHLYHTNPYTLSVSGTTKYEIFIGSGGDGFTVTNNVIGYSSPAAVGTYSITGSTQYSYIYGLYLSVGTGVPTSVQGNTISNISQTITGSGYYGYIYCMYIPGGSVNVGNITPNTIGGATGNDKIYINNNLGSTTSIYGIYCTSSTGATVNIQNNNIGGLTTATSSSSYGASIYGLYMSSSANVSVTGNTIGSTSTTNSIYASSVANTTQTLYGIYASISSAALVPPVIANNTIANLTNLSNYLSGSNTAGIYFPSSAQMNINNNSIHDISSASGYTTITTLVSVAGIMVAGSTNPTNVSQNTIYAISNTNTGALATQAAGIFYTGAINGSITRNKIYDIRNASTGTSVTTPPIAAGIILYSPGTSITIANNMISLGNSQTGNVSFTGIMNNLNTTYTEKSYYNSINIEGTVSSGSNNTAAYKRGNYSTTSFTSITEDVRNNIFVNNRSGGTGKHYAISNNGSTASSTGWGTNASNYNILKAANSATVGFWTTDKTFSAWQSASASDANSFSTSTVTFTNTATGDLHINMGTTPNDIESHGTAIAGINTDYDNDSRPGPAGSTNGGAIAPDLGADEFDGVPNDNLPPTITYTNLLGACGTGDRTLTATIADYSGVPTSGTLRPKIYYKRTIDATWYSQYGSLTSGTGYSGTWSFPITAADMSGLATGDIVQYYVIAQDNIGQVGAIPSAGLSASNVNTVTTPPSSPNTYTVLITLSGTKTVGSGGDYATITAAAAAYNNACLSGAVTFSLISPTYPSETFPITLNSNPFASATNMLTISPASGTAVTINGPSTVSAIFKFLNARYITLDGVNTGGTSLTLNSTYTSTFANIWLASTASTGPGCNRIAIKNMNIVGGSNSITNYGVLAGQDNGSTPTTTAGVDNDSITVQGNTFTKMYYGIYATGTAFSLTGGLNDWTISGNTFGPASYSTTDNIYYRGIYLNNVIRTAITGNTMRNIGLSTYSSNVTAIWANTNCDSLNISQNDIGNVSASYGYYFSPTAAIYFGSNVLNSKITRNNIHDISNPSTSTYYTGMGIVLYTSNPSSNILVANNMISNITGNNYNSYSYWPTGLLIYGSTGGVKVYYNSISLSGSVAGYATGATGSACIVTPSSGTNIDLRDNILSNTMHNSNNSGDKGYALYATGSAATFSNIDYNDYYVDGTNVLGYITSDKTTISAMQAATGGDVHSQSVQPVFVAANNLHLAVVGANVPFIGSGTPLALVTNDYDGTTRSGTSPVQGAHEVNIPACNTVPLTAGTPTPVTSVFCNSGNTTINGTGATGAVGITYQWLTSADSTSWTTVAGATNGNYTPLTSITATTFYRLRIGCSTTGMFDSAATRVSVYPVPAAITGTPLVCVGSTTSLASATSGGSWISSAPGNATVGSSTGVVTGVASGASTITYQLTTTGCFTTAAVNVSNVIPTVAASASPGTICSGGNSTLTANLTTTLPGYNLTSIPYSFTTQTSPTTVSSWLSGTDDTYAPISLPFSFSFWGTSYTTVNIGTNGYVTFGTPSSSLSVYSLPTTSMPPMIAYAMGDLDVLSPGTVKYSTEGTSPNRTFVMTFDQISPCCSFSDQYDAQIKLYESTNTVDVLVSKSASGTHTIGIQNAGTQAVTPAGRNAASYSITTTPEAYRFSVPAPTYTWSPATFLATTTGNVVTANSVTATGSATFTVTANYNGCSSSAATTVTVNPLPNAITGTAQVCAGLTTNLATTSTGGSWTSSNASVATVGSATGVVTGGAAGTATVSYTFASTGCSNAQVVTVNPLPADITGTAAACVGATTNLADATPSGSWSSGTTAIATVGSLDGVVSGVSAGLAMITFTLPTGCIKSVEATINPLPATTISPASLATICQGDNTAFTANAPQPSFSILLQDFNAGLGTWTITNTSGTTASYWQVVGSTYSGATGDGSPMLESAADATGGAPTTTILTSPGFSTVGYGSGLLTFNQYLISLATSDANVDVDYSINNGSTWSPVISQVGVVSGSGSWSSSSTPEVSVALPSGALGQPNVKLRWHYNSNWGLYWDIDNIKVTAYQPPVTYAWSGVSGASGLSCAACATTTITPTATGANQYQVVSTTSAGCQATSIATVNVNPLPGAISGATQVCVNGTATLTDADAGGTWSSSDATVAVDAATGVVTGVSAGTAQITYTVATGCRITAPMTVNPQPATITGVQQVCEGLTTTLSETTTGGTWSSSFPSVATVDASGVVSGIVAGAADIYYTLTSTGCRIAANVTVNPTPSAITGGMQVCEGSTTALSDADASGTWTSGTTAVATVDATTGVVTGVVAGASVITYQLPTGCINTATVTVNAVPAAITGTRVVCQGLTTALDNATTGGTWSTASSAATVASSGVVTGVTPGVATITYQLSTTCQSTADVTVNPTPAAITGTPQVCQGLTASLSDADAGGTWASGSTGIATVDATTGVVTGVIPGTSTITYQLPTGCINTVDMVVNPTPATIGGVRQVCEGMTTTLSDADAGGTWASSAFGTADVDATGIVTGFSSGVSTITYQLPTGCINTADVTVNAVPAAISGADQVCEGQTTVLTNGTAGGSWSSSTPSVASVDAGGTVYAYVAGNTTISYTLSATGCVATKDVAVNPSPAAITGVMQVCEGATTNLANASAGGTWSTSSIVTASVDVSGVVSGINAGTAPITYMLPTGCQTVSNVTVNALPAAITGGMQVCEGANTTLFNSSPGGAWTSGATGIATVAAGTGVVTGVTAGNAAITYTLPTGCQTNASVTVDPVPAAITGTLQVCPGSTTGLSSATAGGAWSSSLPSVASVTAATGVVSGVNMGNATITYTLPSSCMTTKVVTVNPLPAPIAGTGQICELSVGLLTDGSAGGTWSSSTPVVATITTTGIVNAMASGTTLITYTLSTGCMRTRVITVNPLPAAITGTMQLCQYATTTLSDLTSGGAWSSSDVTVASISSTGVANSGLTGTTTITYMLPTGCKTTGELTVNTLPSTIAGSPNACEGNTTTLSNTVAGGTWASGSTAVATVDATYGVVTGVTAGSTVITYELPTGCRATRNIVINPQPAAISGTPQVCYGSTATLSDVVTGGVWSTSNPAVANIGLMSGVLTGLAAGSVDVSYTLLTGCAVAIPVVVNPLPAAIAGSLNVCNGQTTALTSATAGGTWSTADSSIAAISTTGTVSGMAPGITVVSYSLATGCQRSSIVTVNALPSAHTIVGGGNYCEGGTGVHIGLDGSNSGIDYQLYSGSTPVGASVSGISGLPLDFGVVMPAGIYVAYGRNASTGCVSTMTGTAAVAVNPVVSPSVNVITASDTVCAGVPVSYTTSVINGGASPAYTWRVNGVIIPGATSDTYSYTPANGDVVTNVMTSSAACASPATASMNRTMTVHDNVMPVANVIATPGTMICDGNTATFNVSSLYGGTSPAFTWLKNGLVAGTGASFAYIPANGDHIAVKMASNYSCRLADSVSSGTVTMTTAPVYIPAITITSNYGFFVNEGTNVTLTAAVAAGGPAPLYQWYLGAAAVPGATGATLTKVFRDGDSVSCQVTGSGLCGMSAFNAIIMHVGLTGVTTTAIGNMDVRLVPNPNKGEFTVKGTLSVKADKDVAIEVTNMLGQVVYRTNVTARGGEVDARIKLDNTLSNGMYMLNMISGDDRKVFHFVLEQ